MRSGAPLLVILFLLLLLFILRFVIALPITVPLRTNLYQQWFVTAMWASYAVLWLAVDYAGLARRVSQPGWIAIALPVVIVSGLALTNARHGWIWTHIEYDGALRISWGDVGEAAVLYGLTLASISLALLLLLWWRARGVLRWQAALLLTGTMFIGVGFLPEILSSPALTSQLAIYALGPAGLAMVAVALLRYRGLDLEPIARHALVEQTTHGMMVVDDKLRVVDLNPAAERLLATTRKEATGRNVREVLCKWPELVALIGANCASPAQISIDHKLDDRCFDASISPLMDPSGQNMGALIFWLDVTGLRAAEAEVSRQERALAALSERERVGGELHDGLAQELALIKIEAQAGSDALAEGRLGSVSAKLGSVLATAQGAHEEVRDFLLGAKVATHSDGDFRTEVIDLIARFRSVLGMDIHVSLPDSADALSLDPIARAQLLRIIPESLANVRRHSGVCEASLLFQCENGWLKLTVHDNGRGFDPNAAPATGDGHFGLRIMQERAREAGGSLEIISAPGQGSTLIVRVPLERKDGPHAVASGG
jgi:PAS domain S-box-containing protein